MGQVSVLEAKTKKSSNIRQISKVAKPHINQTVNNVKKLTYLFNEEIEMDISSERLRPSEGDSVYRDDIEQRNKMEVVQE